ncbi:MAG: adenylate cyclase [Frankiales bacterium]|jgi:adenylate cyclase|nr:adenylate cyclase [Frankiales bacterium]
MARVGTVQDGRARKALEGAREANSRPTVVGAVRRLRRVLPGDPGFGDPLSAAGRDPAGTVARLADRLFADTPRASRELGMGLLQLWQAAAERTGRGAGDAELTILFTDLVGFSSWALEAGDEAALELLRAVASAVEPPVLAHRGKVVKRLGDGLMATFPAPQLAFEAVQQARARLAAVEVAGHRPRLKAALHTGRPKAMGGDLLGVDVNIAARLVEKAGADEVLVSDTALAGLDPDSITTRRKKTFALTNVKGIPTGMVVYAVAPRQP